ncbi:hypothetical protein D3C75_1018580 [compost metagenome]
MTARCDPLVADDEADLLAIEVDHHVEVFTERAGVGEVDSGQSSHSSKSPFYDCSVQEVRLRRLPD